MNKWAKRVVGAWAESIARYLIENLTDGLHVARNPRRRKKEEKEEKHEQ